MGGCRDLSSGFVQPSSRLIVYHMPSKSTMDIAKLLQSYSALSEDFSLIVPSLRYQKVTPDRGRSQIWNPLARSLKLEMLDLPFIGELHIPY